MRFCDNGDTVVKRCRETWRFPWLAAFPACPFGLLDDVVMSSALIDRLGNSFFIKHTVWTSFFQTDISITKWWLFKLTEPRCLLSVVQTLCQ